jgi:hypothetical protein
MHNQFFFQFPAIQNISDIFHDRYDFLLCSLLIDKCAGAHSRGHEGPFLKRAAIIIAIKACAEYIPSENEENGLSIHAFPLEK